MARVRKSRRPAKRAKPTAGRTRTRETPQRLTPEKVRLRQILASVFTVFFVLSFIIGGIYSISYLQRTGFFHDQWIRLETGFYQTARDFGFRVREVVVYGRERTTREELESVLPFAPGESLFIYNLEGVAGRLKTLPWVAEAVVQRRLPSRILVYIKERQPLALWQLDSDIYLIDQSGQIIPGQPVDRYEELQLVVGVGANTQAGHFLTMLESEPDIMKRVVAGIWVGQRRWNLLIDNGIFVNLPEDKAEEAYRDLARLQNEHGILQKNVRVIDLRLQDRLILELPEDAPKPLGRKEQRT